MTPEQLAEARAMVEWLRSRAKNSDCWCPKAQAADTITALLAHIDAQAEAVRAEERHRIVAGLEDEADVTPCYEDAVVVRDCAKLVRAGFSYDEADAQAQREADYCDMIAVWTQRETEKDRRIAVLEAALEAFASVESWNLGGPCDPNSPSFVGTEIASAALADGKETT